MLHGRRIVSPSDTSRGISHVRIVHSTKHCTPGHDSSLIAGRGFGQIIRTAKAERKTLQPGTHPFFVSNHEQNRFRTKIFFRFLHAASYFIQRVIPADRLEFICTPRPDATHRSLDPIFTIYILGCRKPLYTKLSVAPRKSKRTAYRNNSTIFYSQIHSTMGSGRTDITE